MTAPTEILEQLRTIVAAAWGEPGHRHRVLEGGINSVAVALDLESGRAVAKWVPASLRAELIGGAEVARRLSALGVRSGPPIPTTDGRLTVPLLGGELVLLREVRGVPLTDSPTDRRDWGRTLAEVHAVDAGPGNGMFFPWFVEHGTDPEREDWVRRGVDLVLAEYDELPTLTWATLHTDPNPDAFLRDADGTIGVIDWTGALRGPVLYDLASAVMYAGGEQRAADLVDGYLSVGVLPAQEMEAHLRHFRRFRGAIQAVYFSKRLREVDLLGEQSQDDNAKGLRDARSILESLGIS